MAWTSWQDSASTVVAAFRYDPEQQVLEIRSRRTGRLRDFHCPPGVYEEFLEARSHGRFVARLAPVKRPWRLRLLPH